ncbi:phosphopantetheine-binding protein [Bacteroides fragilis]|nr:phosphopantetheine-binding protein [Bacteroides fragilis]
MDVEQEVKGAISRILNIAEEKVTMNLFIGDVEEWDSMGNMAIIAALEEQFEVEFPVEELFELTSVAAFVDMIKSFKEMMDLSHSPLLQAISNNAEKFANRVALIEGNSQVSYSELWKKIIDAASFLCYIGLQYGDNIILSARKELEFVYIYFGAHLLGVRMW